MTERPNIRVVCGRNKKRSRGLYKHLQLPPIEVLNIEDDYEFMDEELVQMLNDRINDTLRLVYQFWKRKNPITHFTLFNQSPIPL